MFRCIVFFLVALSSSLACSFASSFAFAADACVELANNDTQVRFNVKTGKIESFVYRGETVSRTSSAVQWFDILQEDKWQYGKYPIVVRGVQSRSSGVLVDLDRGPWNVKTFYSLDRSEPMLSCRVAIQWNGDKETKLKGFWIDMPETGSDAGTSFFMPGQYPPKRCDVSELTPRTKRSAGGATPALIVQRALNRSYLFVVDDATPESDRSGLEIERVDGDRLRVKTTFQIQARMKKGDVQRVGTAYMKIADTDGEGTLRLIHPWMKKVGHVVPKDRPKWFESATLYSFHPGGTIGSNCRDLGGFANALGQIDRIKELGMNAIWIMPIEDRSIYWPRDYYKFQEGLGTGDEYRKLVSYAHERGLHVLQDCVPHGGSDTFPRALEHPEWLVRDEQGKTLHYWCFDFNHPQWRDYMQKVVKYYMSQYDVDGYRVDAVSGSKIPNWAETLPYGRASLALRQGGLNMLRSLRSGVKELKPQDAALLAETSGSCYGIVSDAIYDFAGCYTVFQDVRRQTPETFVTNLRRWLHEQQYAELDDLLRLRHVESHDSLRSRLWYGGQPARALLALTAFVHGIPLVYHEQEIGSVSLCAQLFDVRDRLEEMHAGTPDYLGVEVPPGVFAVKRTKGALSSVALVNFNYTPVRFPLEVGNSPVVTDMFKRSSIAPRKGKVEIALEPYGYTAIALRDFRFDDGIPSPVAKEPRPTAKKPEPLSGAIRMKGETWAAWIDPASGMLRALENTDGRRTIFRASLTLPEKTLQSESPIRIVCEPKANPVSVAVERVFSGATLALVYTADKDGLRLATSWSGRNIPDDAALNLGVVDGAKWNALAAEACFADRRLVRNAGVKPHVGNIYQRAQGTETLFDSLTAPLDSWSDRGMWLGCETKDGAPCTIAFETVPTRVQWLGRVPNCDLMTAAVYWTSRDLPFAPDKSWSCVFTPKIREPLIRYPSADEISKTQTHVLIPVAGGWLFENAHYRLILMRNGSIRSLARKDAAGVTAILDSGAIYTDYGFAERGKRFSSESDVEAAAHIAPCDGGLRLRFAGALRGSGRFDLLANRVLYSMEYVLNDGPDFTFECKINAGTKPAREKAFLALRMTCPEADAWQFEKDGKRLDGGSLADKRGRVGQTKNGVAPDSITLARKGKKLLTFDAIAGQLPGNIFLDAHQLFFASCDNEEPDRPRDCSWKMKCRSGD